MTENIFDRERLTQEVLQEWQRLLDEAAGFLKVPAGLITRVNKDEIEVLLSSESKGNPYKAESRSTYPDSGWYCEHTLKSRGLNLIPNALNDPKWKNNAAAVNLQIVSYMGLPILRPDGELFGTVCFLDNKQNAHNDMNIWMVGQIRRMVELTLRVVHEKHRIISRDRYLKDLSRIYPICSFCKKVRDTSGSWVEVEKYVEDISGAQASHSICPDCCSREYSSSGDK